MEKPIYRSTSYREPRRPVGAVAELFAGVGGFRIGLARAGWKTVFSNQWEPSTVIQHASDVYINKFGPTGHSNEDIAKLAEIPDDVDLVVGGFPCQDYSVAKSVNSALGIVGKKGVLWWEILRLLRQSVPKFVLLENVDRLLKSPVEQRGRDFAIILKTLASLGYQVEWRVINAAEYGFPQRRKRVFIFAYQADAGISGHPELVISQSGVLARAFPVSGLASDVRLVDLSQPIDEVSDTFNAAGKTTPFLNSGFFDGEIATTFASVASQPRKSWVLGDVLVPDDEVPENFWVSDSQLPLWAELKGAKSIQRIHKGSGTPYVYAEGRMAFPDSADNPSRTILTAEGGSSPSRFRHVVLTARGHRRLLPLELERLSGFPDHWTMMGASGRVMSDSRRAFFVGNALVTGVVEKIGQSIADSISEMAVK